MGKNTYVCYSFRLMRYLDRLGFKFSGARPDSVNSDRVVFLYDKSPDLMKAIQEYLDLKK